MTHPAITPELEQLRALVREFALKEVQPLAEKMDAEEYFPRELLCKAGELGLIGLCLPEEYGGSGLGLLAAAITREELARVSAAFAASVVASGMYFGLNLAKHGSEAQKRKYLPKIASGEAVGAWALTEPEAGSNSRAIKTSSKLVDGRFVINGQKIFITNGPAADFLILHTRRLGLAEGAVRGTAFIIERGMPGLEFGPTMHKMGFRGSPTGALYFDDLTVGPQQVLGVDGEDMDDTINSLDSERVLVLFSGLGMAQACLDEMARYAGERVQFGRPIASYQLIKEKIAYVAQVVDLARVYGYNLVWRLESGLPVRKEAAIGKYFIADAVMQCAVEAVQVFGGHGFMKGALVERLMRDAKILAIGGGTTEIQKLIIAKEVLAEYSHQRR